MNIFKKGDRVKSLTGHNFKHGRAVGIVSGVNGERIGIKGTNDWVHVANLEACLDLTTIDTPFGELDRCTQVALFEAWMDGADIVIVRASTVVPQPQWDTAVAYRVEPKKSQQQLEKEWIGQEMDKLQKRLDNLEVT